MAWLWLLPALVVTVTAAVIVSRRPSRREVDETRQWADAMDRLKPKGHR